MCDRSTDPSRKPDPAPLDARRFHRRLAVAGAWFALAAATVPLSANAENGESADSVGIYSASTAGCETLRQRTQVPGGAVIFACNADRRTTNGRKACDIFSLSTVVRGSALGFCADTLPNVSLVTAPVTVLETAKTLQSSSYGVNIGMVLPPLPSPGSPPTNTVDTVCTTFAPTSTTIGKNAAQGVRACRQVRPCPNDNCGPPPSCTDSGGQTYLKTYKDNVACGLIQQQLAATVTGSETPQISHALFLSATANVGKPGSQALLVCSGFTWTCGDPASADGSGGSQIDYQIGFGNLETPGCVWTRTVTGTYKQICF